MHTVTGQAAIDLLDGTLSDIAAELGCPNDNEDILMAIHELKEGREAAYERGRAAGQVDGDRWRALMSSARIRILGTAGFDPSTGRNPPGYRHFGAEFWTHHDTPSEDGPRIVTEFADAIMARSTEGQS